LNPPVPNESKSAGASPVADTADDLPF